MVVKAFGRDGKNNRYKILLKGDWIVVVVVVGNSEEKGGVGYL